ncbi:hypothetical protein CWE09_04810 [Aliidiomarina minuta]|uniref:Superinfection immunity protein n=1 Tax=Aliidiomarina minuta TaxID=880057 RepID=A0A432W7S2_9GAMM|nr:superinfection immunity protein [Aliidiomarina minuta]RUO26051.1 hypothetical protein CWE09_04810 [Aliidiomarina minuta]
MFEHLAIIEKFSQMNLFLVILFVPLFLAVYFIPGILAIFFNRRHVKKIWLANIPAGLSFIAWGALIVWAVTGKRKVSADSKTIPE